MKNTNEKRMPKPSYARKIVFYEYTCQRCGHTWLPKTTERPAVCPRCKTARWDQAKEE